MTEVSTQTIQPTFRVDRLHNGRVGFDDLASVYRVPPHLEPLFRTALETRRKVKFTADRTRAIYAAELLPPPPPLVRLRQRVERLRRRLIVLARRFLA